MNEISDTYPDFLYRSLKETQREVLFLRKVIEKIMEQDLYTSSLDYDWDENAIENYDPFEIDGVFEEVIDEMANFNDKKEQELQSYKALIKRPPKKM